MARKEVGFILDAVKPRAFITAERFGRMVFDADVCAGVPIVAVVGSSFDALVDIEPMEGTLATDPAGPTLDRVHFRHHQQSQGRDP